MKGENLKVKYPYKKIGSRIRRLRKESHLTQTELANILDRHPAYISAIERGRFRPPRVLLYALSNIFRVPATQLDADIFADGLETNGREFLEK